MKKVSKKALEKAFRAGFLVGYPIAGLVLHKSHRVRVVVMSGKEILLVRSTVGDQKWGFPGGGISRGESVEAAAVRELEEETGLNIDPEKLEVIAEKILSKKRRWPSITLTYLVVQLDQPTQPKVTRPLEILEAAWFPIGSLPKRLSANVEIGLSYLEKSPKTNLRVLK